jgi:glycerol uptake facilitator-like aquaporin
MAGCCGEATGACFNPTLGIVSATFVAIVRKGTGLPTFIEYLPSYIFGPLIGAALAGIVCKYCIMPVVPHYYDELR